MRDSFSGNLLTLFAVFAPLSLLSFGGSNSVIADIAHQSVAVQHWTSEREFADLFALSRAAPGPGSMLAALIGWKLAGLTGAVVATMSFYGPAALLVFLAAKIWGRWRGSAWHQAVERGMAPIAAGLFLSGGIAVLRVSPAGIAAWIAAGAAAAALLYWPKLHPVPLLAVSGVIFGLADWLVMSTNLPAEFYQHLVTDSPDAVIYADAAGHIRFWNGAATRIFGFAESEAPGLRLDLIIPDRLRARHWEGYDKVMGGAASRYGEGALLAVPAMHKDGRQISVEFTILPLHDEAGRLIGIAAFLRDATARFEEIRGLRREIAALKRG